MGVLDKDRPRGLRVPSLAALKAFNKKAPESPTPKELPAIQLPAPSQLSSDSIPVRPPRPLEKELPPSPLPSSLPQSAPPNRPQPPLPAPASNSTPPPGVVNPVQRKPQPQPQQQQQQQQYQQQLYQQQQQQQLYQQQQQPIRNEYPPRLASASRPAPQHAPQSPVSPTSPLRHQFPQPAQPLQRPIPRPAPPPVVSPVAVQQRTPPSSEGDPEQRHSNGSSDDSLEGFIPDPEPEPEHDGASSNPNEPGSSEDDDRPWTPPEVEPVVVPLSKLHYSCYQDHRAMPTSNNVWYALPCMTCQKFDREIRHRCVFCCLRVCADCFQALQKCPRRSLAQLMETLSVDEAVISDE
ncbi:hypothetical protein AOCH_007066 [Aspergillus ochraceoroseus]|uniref:Uncharacterized protein n=1 Tax=Aspergillus ochraceoroseus TaxID=138278 RepID=A0A0F8WZZ5_9EURO|nr:hypothetical protein AOCH_007066 [Aspergillus ochraceoroseus]